MKRMFWGALVLGLAMMASPGWALDSNIDLVVEDWGTEYMPIVDSVEYQQIWNGVMSDGLGTWSWNRVGFRVVDQSPVQPAEVPNIKGYGVTYGYLSIENEYGAMRAFAAAVEDPRKRYDGYYGRLAGIAPDGAPFEGTLKFEETNDGHLLGEVDLVVNGGTDEEPKEVYYQPIALKGIQTSGEMIEYFNTQPLMLYDDMMLFGHSTGTMMGPVELEIDAVRLGNQPDPQAFNSKWKFMKPADGWAVGEADVPGGQASHARVGEGSVWMRIAQDLQFDPPSDNYMGMYLAHPTNADTRIPAFTVEGDYSFLTGHFLGDTEQLYCIPGDLNGDRKVGSKDLDTVRAHWNEKTLAGEYLQGDCSRDGVVGSRDLDMVRAHWGGPWITPVPEPGMFTLLAGFALALLGGRRRS